MSTAMATQIGPFTIEWQRALVPLSLLAMFVGFFYFKVPLWALALFSLWLPLYYVVYPRVLERQWGKFERQFAQKFQAGEYKALLEDYKAAWFLRKFAPKGEMLNKLALIYLAMEKYREAEQVLEQAMHHLPPGQRDRLYINLGNVKYELGKYDEAEAMYKTLRESSPYRKSLRTQLALLDLRRGLRVEHARRHLEGELSHASGALKKRIEDALDATA
jgi:tetratricopeptide (TPR) repeat protein